MLTIPAAGLLTLALLTLTGCANGPETTDAAAVAAGTAQDQGASAEDPRAEDPRAEETRAEETRAEETRAKETRAEETPPTAIRPDPAPLQGDAAQKALQAHVVELELREEHDAERVKVQHILISFAGRQVPEVTRSRDEAERLTAELYQRVRAGEDFATLMEEYSDDTGAGTYAMHTEGPPQGAFRRRGMVPAFGNVGWRLEVGEVGVARFDQRNSPYGWHIVKRIE